MATVIPVTSFKGGVGKTTVSCAIAMLLASRGHSVVICDADLESRCLDLVAGLTEVPLFNVCDAVKGTCDLDAVLVSDERFPTLSYITAPAFYPEAVSDRSTDGIFTPEAVGAFVSALRGRFDYVIFDLPARPDGFYKQLLRQADAVLVVSLPTATSIRSAEKTAIAVHELRQGLPEADVRLIVNGFRPADVKAGDGAGLYDILSRTRLALAGVIPYDAMMMREQEKGTPAAASSKSLSFTKAVSNIVSRIEGRHVRLLAGIRTGVRNRDLY